MSGRSWRDALQDGRFIDLREFLQMNPDIESYDRRCMYYQEAHTLVTFLLERRRSAFFAYMKAERETGKADLTLFEKHFGQILDHQPGQKQGAKERVRELYGVFFGAEVSASSRCCCRCCCYR